MYTIGWINADGGVYAVTEPTAVDAVWQCLRIQACEWELGIGIQSATVEAFLTLMRQFKDAAPFASEPNKPRFSWLRDTQVEWGIDELHVICPFLKYAYPPREGR